MAKKLDMSALLKGKKAQEEGREAGKDVEAKTEVQPAKAAGASLSDTAADEPVRIAQEGRDRSAKIVDIRNLNIVSQVRGFSNNKSEPITQERIEELAELIQQNPKGKVKSPILIDKLDDGDTVWDGETRVHSCKYLAEKYADESFYFQPARYVENDDKADEFERYLSQASINGSGEDVPLDVKVALITEAKKRGFNDSKLAQKMGINRTTVMRIGKISGYPDDIQDMIFAGDLPYTGRTLEKALKEYDKLHAAPVETVSETQLEENHVASLDDKGGNDEAASTSAPEPAKPPKKDTKQDTKKAVKAAVTKKETVSVSKDSLESLVALVCLLGEKQGMEIMEPDFGSKAELKKFIDGAQSLIEEVENS